MMSKPCIGLGCAWQNPRCTSQYKQRSAHGPCICPCLHLLRSLWWHWRLPHLPRSRPLNLMFASTARNKMHKNEFKNTSKIEQKAGHQNTKVKLPIGTQSCKKTKACQIYKTENSTKFCRGSGHSYEASPRPVDTC